jgi:hypothetical protein
MSVPSENRQIAANKVQSRDHGISSVDALFFLIPLFRVIQVRVGGLLSGADILLLITFVSLAVRRKINIQVPGAKPLLLLCSLWLGSQCATDIVRHSAFADYARGWSNIGLTIVNFLVFFSLLYGRKRRILLYGWGLAIAAVLVYLVNPDTNMAVDPWKFAFGFAITWGVFLFLSRKGIRGYSPVIISTMIGIINIALGSRSLGGFSLATSFYLFIALRNRKRIAMGVTMKASSALAIAATLILGVACIVWGYQHAARTGILGADAQTKYEKQSSGKFGFLLGGRIEMLGSIPAILDSPILGHGSWAKDPKYLIIERQALAVFGYDMATDDLSLEGAQLGLIPSHSYILGAWVDAGVLGGIFWIWVFGFVVKSIIRLYATTSPLLPYATFVAFSLLWDIPYSPYGAQQRIISPFFIVALMTCMAYVPKKMIENPILSSRRIALAASRSN